MLPSSRPGPVDATSVDSVGCEAGLPFEARPIWSHGSGASMDFPGIRTIDVIRALPWQPAPWVVVSVLIGLIGASLFFVLAGRGLRSLPTYLALGLLAGPLCHLATARLPHPFPGLMIGEL